MTEIAAITIATVALVFAALAASFALWATTKLSALITFLEASQELDRAAALSRAHLHLTQDSANNPQ